MRWHTVVALDSDVIVAAGLSPTRALRYLLREVGLGRLTVAASVPFMIEYEAVLRRPDTLDRAGGTPEDMNVICVAESAPSVFDALTSYRLMLGWSYENNTLDR